MFPWYYKSTMSYLVYIWECLYAAFSECNKCVSCISVHSVSTDCPVSVWLRCRCVLGINDSPLPPAGQTGYCTNHNISLCLLQTCWGQSVSIQIAVVLLRSPPPTPTVTLRSVCVFVQCLFLSLDCQVWPFMLKWLIWLHSESFLTRRRGIPAD